MLLTMWFNIAVNIILHIILAVNIIPKIILKVISLIIDITIEIADGMRAGLDILRTMMGSIDNHVSGVNYLVMQAIKSVMVNRDRSTSTLIDQALE